MQIIILRSIPAHAGEPGGLPLAVTMSGVYPRPRGGTGAGTEAFACHNGLSPPTRGNPLKRHQVLQHIGSIPAHAGEPPKHTAYQTAQQVYPRPRGGTPYGRNRARS